MPPKPHCFYCLRPGYSGGKRPLCEPHFEMWLIISHLKKNGLPVIPDTIQAQMIVGTATGHPYSFTMDQVAELLDQLSPEIKGTAVKAA